MDTSPEYVKALDKATVDLEERIQKRQILNAEIERLRETVRALSGLGGVQPEKRRLVAELTATVDFATSTLPAAIRSLVYRSFPTALTALDVHNRLKNSGFSFADFSNPLSACHAALKRWADADKNVEVRKAKDGKTTYRTPLPMNTPATDFLPVGHRKK